MNIKHISFVIVFIYLLISLPAILGIGYVIDWVPEATLFQKLTGYVWYGLVENFLFKIVIACIGTITVSFIFRRHLTT